MKSSGGPAETPGLKPMTTVRQALAASKREPGPREAGT